MTMLRTESLCLRQGEFVLRGVSLECAEGECLALLGPSGSGKTTCLEIAAGLRRADVGRVWIGGQDATALPPEARAVSYLPQDVALFPHLSVRGNVLFPARMRRVRPDAARLERLCAMLELAPLLTRSDVRSLSGGEAQRVAIARALLVPPRVLFLDECFGSLDAPLRRRLARQFRELREATGTTTVMVTHDIEEACLMAGRLAIMDRGAVLQTGTPAELHRRPATVAVAEVLGMQNVLPVRSCRPGNGYWHCDAGGIELAAPLSSVPSPPRHLGFFAWDIRPTQTAADDSPEGTNRFRLRVVDCVLQGAGPVLRLSTEGLPPATIEVQWDDAHGACWQRGEWVEVEIAADRIRAWSENGPHEGRVDPREAVQERK